MWSATWRRATKRCSASDRFRSWLRSSSATTRISGPRRSISRWRCPGPNATDFSMSKRSSTRVAVLLACWPPGPPDALNETCSSRRGIRTERVTSKSSSLTSSPAPLQSQQLSRQPHPEHLKWACSGSRSLPQSGHSGYVPSTDRQVASISTVEFEVKSECDMGPPFWRVWYPIGADLSD